LFRQPLGPSFHSFRAWASRCFLSEFRRVIFALAAWTASVLLGCFFLATDTFASLPAVGMIGSIWVGAVRSCLTGCMTIGLSGFLLAMAVNACPAVSFEASEWNNAHGSIPGPFTNKNPARGLTGSRESEQQVGCSTAQRAAGRFNPPDSAGGFHGGLVVCFAIPLKFFLSRLEDRNARSDFLPLEGHSLSLLLFGHCRPFDSRALPFAAAIGA
jgi:hypothetical protein